MVQVLQEAIGEGLTQSRACEIFGIAPRKFRRWTQSKPLVPRTAWNKILPQERDAIVQTALDERFLGKPLSHIFVYGHESGKFCVSLSTIYNVLHSEKLVRHIRRHPRNGAYVSAHSLLKEGFSLLCYDGTCFVTETGIKVWAIPVMVLPFRYLLCIGHSLNGVSSSDLVRAISEALARLPEYLQLNLIAHSDRGSAMKAWATKIRIKDLLGAPVHYGRPHTPDDEAWIEAFIKTLKYHRERPASFPLVDDVVSWLDRFPEIYNNDPHSSLKYVTPLQAISGLQEVIVNHRKENMASACKMRYAHWQGKRTTVGVQPVASEVVMLHK